MRIEFKCFTEKELPFVFEKTLEKKSPLLNEPVSFGGYRQFEDYFFNQLQRYYHDFYIVVGGTKPIGFVFTYDYRVYDGNCKLIVCVDSHHTETVQAITKVLFDDYPIRKIFCWVREDDFEMRKALDAFVGTPEAVLQEYIFSNGKYHDALVYGISRKE